MERFASDPDRRCCLRSEAKPENVFKIRILTLRFKNLSGRVEDARREVNPSRVSPRLPFRNQDPDRLDHPASLPQGVLSPFLLTGGLAPARITHESVRQGCRIGNNA
ncbi:hypothetical protein Poly21_57430 [Allorhodopirellula heiligendammensis]|uniref:Uncharacterized protein n=1 Tax=Allorhodopirellula heiligendammensis TaxID=2714739 RepID=A0A5C6B0C1_9BACT|nr:hypothetical protein Poly21_57430 [Allorhodopirellula heiligendammensis]